MLFALRLAYINSQLGRRPSACIIVDPWLGQVLSCGVDLSTRPIPQVTRAADVPSAFTIDAICPVSQCHLSLSSANFEFVRGIEEEYLTLAPSTPIAHSLYVALRILSRRNRNVSEILLPRSPSSQAAKLTVPDTPYFASGLHAFMVGEPCVFCAMAATHSRLGRIVYGGRNYENQGALGGSISLHSVPALHHHIDVWRGIREEES